MNNIEKKNKIKPEKKFWKNLMKHDLNLKNN